MKSSNVTIIIPTLNEAETIGILLKELQGMYKGSEILVVDDQSTDSTQEKVRQFKHVTLMERAGKKPGLTASVIDAVLAVKTPYLVVIDGDLQHPPKTIKKLVERLETGSDICIGTRTKVIGPWPLHRRLMSRTATALATMRLSRPVRDPLSGYFAVRTKLFQDLIKKHTFVGSGYKVLFELLRVAETASIEEVEYTFGERRLGKSKIGTRHIVAFLKSLR